MSIPNPAGDSPLLYGYTRVPAVARTLQAYLVRPDEIGESPTVMLIPSAWGLTASVKDLCRRLGRFGLAVIAPDLYRGKLPDRDANRNEAEDRAGALTQDAVVSDLVAVVGFITNPAGFWSSAQNGFGILGVGSGGVWATLAALQTPDHVVALGLCYVPLRLPEIGEEEEGSVPAPEFPLQLLNKVEVPILGLYGREDEVVPLDDVHAAREQSPGAEWLIYEGVGHDFLDDHLQAYEPEAARDVVERLAEFFGAQLPR